MEQLALHGAGWQAKVAWFLRIVILLAGLCQVLLGEMVIGIYILLSWGAITFPALLTRNYISSIPTEFELIFSVMVILQFIIGETLNFYGLFPYYDKFVHFTLPLLVGVIGFLLAYALYQTGNLNMSAGPVLLLTILLTLGIGAAWEIVEYLSDTFLAPMIDGLGRMQGSSTASPLVDTMNDLIVDTVGGIFGAILSLRYIRTEQHDEDSELSRLVDKIAASFRKK